MGANYEKELAQRTEREKSPDRLRHRVEASTEMNLGKRRVDGGAANKASACIRQRNAGDIK